MVIKTGQLMIVNLFKQVNASTGLVLQVSNLGKSLRENSVNDEKALMPPKNSLPMFTTESIP
jgi:hypothetical protein